MAKTQTAAPATLEHAQSQAAILVWVFRNAARGQRMEHAETTPDNQRCSFMLRKNIKIPTRTGKK